MGTLHIEVAGTGRFLPGEPVTNQDVETLLGAVPDAPPAVQTYIQNVGPRMLERSGVVTRHYAIDRETKKATHSFSSLAEPACRQALEQAGMAPGEIDLLITSSPIPDYATPPTSTILQERLGIERCAELEIHSNCTGVGKGVEVAFHALRSGQYRTALVTYSQLSSLYLRSAYFNQQKMDKVHATMRWILSDGAGAVVLRAVEGGEPKHPVLGTNVSSVGGSMPAGMIASAAGVDLLGYSLSEVYANGSHHLWQDFRAVDEHAARVLLGGIQGFVKKLGLDSAAVDHYIVSVPSLPLYNAHIPPMARELGVDLDRIRFHSAHTGYCGAAATLVAFDEMARAGAIRPGETVVVQAVESSKWMTAGFAVRW
jgi:3-oxoacyl-[acyl-carrier-protein] synthase-3